MNIRKYEEHQDTQLFESEDFSHLTEKDLKDFLKNFPDNATSWKDATGEPGEMRKWLCETLELDYKPTPNSSPSVLNKANKKGIMDMFPKLDAQQKKNFFEQYGHWMEAPLFESDASMDNHEEAAIEDVLDTKGKQFDFENGAAMANLLSSVDTQFGLLWHDAKTQDWPGFVASVREFLRTAEIDMTGADEAALELHYNKYNWRAKLAKQKLKN
jgi:hypothetical protein